ncbi:membrane protein [Nitrincola sp. A-D6]|uniref:NAD(P)/FAD-dependent oxidoreductase n=1 Tax=Nitrincola sp. A-D6 TaxID=1545442 RepID=UPI00051FDE05|nr:NAD(P)/FAD-dependent oxidoreductase [Nitrincola sp. A-D6]KGK41729.1 membrane protein [Nitrincola sp. A-D6]
MRYFDCVIIGAGAAGLMCAATAGQRGRRVLVVDHANKVGKKILMSGGGRCNFTNQWVEPANFLSANPHFCISALKRFSQYDFLSLVDKHQLAYHEKTLGQLFCDNRAKDILNILLAECEAGGVTIETRCAVQQITQLSSIDTATHTQQTEPDTARFELQTALGPVRCESLVVATGGPSIPTLGASGFGYDLARQFGLQVTDLQASLVPFTFKGERLALAQSLAGVALPVSISCNNQTFKEALLFTHKGLSGPAVLQISNYWHPGEAVQINFLPDHDLQACLREWQQAGEKAELKTLLSRLLPKRVVLAWLAFPELQALVDKPVAQLSHADIAALASVFQCWSCIPAGTEGYKTAEVTRGGVCTDQISSKTFETKSVAGLYFIGEVLDVTGWLGGFNFQWAWSSGWCAGQYV